MGFFSKLFGGSGRKVELLFGDPEASRVHQTLCRGAFEEARLLLNAIDDVKDRQFYCTALSDLRTTIPPPVFDAWLKAYPTDGNAALLKGMNLLAAMWMRRGAGAGSSVTDDDKTIIINMLRDAEANLVRAAELLPRDPMPYAARIEIGMHLGLGIDHAQGLFQDAVERSPGHFMAHRMMLRQLAKKWGGSHELMFAFARRHGGGASDELAALIVEAHLDRFVFASAFEGDPNAVNYWEATEVKEEVNAAYDRSLGRADFISSRVTTIASNEFAFGFWQTADAIRAHREFGRLNGRVTTYPWAFIGDSAKMFADAEKWATGAA